MRNQTKNFKKKYLLHLDFREGQLDNFIPAQIKAMVAFHQQNPWLIHRKINRRSNWFCITWRLLVHDLNSLGPQNNQDYWIRVWENQIIQAKVTAAFGRELNETQVFILNLIFKHHQMPEYLKDESLMDGNSLASTIPLLEDEDLEMELVLEEE